MAERRSVSGVSALEAMSARAERAEPMRRSPPSPSGLPSRLVRRSIGEGGSFSVGWHHGREGLSPPEFVMCKAMEEFGARREARGKREGKREAMLVMAKRLLANGKLMLKEIAECTGLSLAQVKKLQASMA